jgi:hypothetical protein
VSEFVGGARKTDRVPRAAHAHDSRLPRFFLNSLCCGAVSAIHYFMKVTLAISSRGVLTLPAKLRQAAGISPADQVVAETTAEGILLRPAVSLPVEISGS